MQKGSAPLIIILGMLVILGIVGGAYYFGKSLSKTPDKSKACTEEAKQCPDGSFVGRVGPNCEFKPCPSVTPKTSDETANWKMYINQKFGFSMKYPKDWIVKENGNNSIWVSNTNEETLIIGVKNATDTVKITKSGTVDVKELVKRGDVEFLQQLVEKDALVFKGNDMSVMYDQAKEIPRGNLVFTLSLDKTIICAAFIGVSCPKILSSTSESIVDQILSTFKFTQ